MTIRSWCLILIHAVLIAALVGACDGEQGETSSSASGSDDAFDAGAHGDDSARNSPGDHPGDAATFFPPPTGEFAFYAVDGAADLGGQWRLDISMDETSFENESYSVLEFGEASGELGTTMKVWADMSDPMRLGVRQIEFHQEGALNGVEWWPLGPLDSDLLITFNEPLAMDFSGQAAGLVSSSGAGRIVINDGVPIDAVFTSTIEALGRDLTVEVPNGTVDRVVKTAIELTQSNLQGDATFGGTFDMQSDLGLVSATLDGGIETIALASLAAP